MALADTETKAVELPGGTARITGQRDDPYFRSVEDRAREMFPLANLAWQQAGTGTLLDVGGNIGLSCISLARARPANQVMVFEPSPTSAALIRHNLEDNHITNVTVVEAAVAHQSSQRVLAFGDSSGSSHLMGAGASASGSLDVEVRVVALDDVVDTEVTFAKIDVEGYEPNVLAGMRRLAAVRAPLIYLEFNPWCLTAFGGHNPAAFAAAIWEYFDVYSAGRDGCLEPIGSTAIDLLYRTIVVNKHEDIVIRQRGSLPTYEELTLPPEMAREITRLREMVANPFPAQTPPPEPAPTRQSGRRQAAATN